MKGFIVAAASLIALSGPAAADCGTFFGTENNREVSGCMTVRPPTDARQLISSFAPADPAPGIFTTRRVSPSRYDLIVTAHNLTSQSDVEKYLAYRAAQLTLDQHDNWFGFVQQRAKGDTVKPPKSDPSEYYDFRLANFQPVWRYQTADSPKWKRWSPFSGKPFLDGDDPSRVTLFETRATVVLHKGTMPGSDALAFNAAPLHDLLVNQVAPPQPSPAAGSHASS